METKPRIVGREELRALLARLIGERAVFAPVGDEWRQLKSPDEINLAPGPVREPAKGFVFPRCEVMFRFQDGEAVVPPAAPDERVVFGLRPCDGRALAFIRRFFAGDDKPDPYVAQRLERTLFIGMSCNEALDSCFCSGVGGSPQGTDGLDLLFTDIGDGFVVDVLTERGAAVWPEGREATAAELEKKAEIAERVASRIKTRIDTTALKARLDNRFEDRVWEVLALECVNCGACTFLCPTCHCFDVSDETVRGRTARLRVWDSCQFPLYSQHASGHNPRFQPGARYRNRVMDKFKYTVDMVGLVSCVGCGRCVRVCPAGIDIRETAAEVLRSAEEGGARSMEQGAWSKE